MSNLVLAVLTTVAYQLGACTDRGCVSIGQPQPKQICEAMRDAMRAEGVQARVLCARVLIDE